MFKHARVLDHVNFEGLKGYHPDAPPPDPSTPAIVSFEFQPSGDGNGMKLMLRNDAGIALKYDATMFVPARDGVESAHTSMCPILPGMMGDENWPHPVVMLLLSNFRKADGTQMVCN